MPPVCFFPEGEPSYPIRHAWKGNKHPEIIRQKLILLQPVNIFYKFSCPIIFKVAYIVNNMDTDQTAPKREQSDQGS